MTGSVDAHHRRSQRFAAGALIVLLALGTMSLVRIVERAWTCDDAFISFRYAKHFIEGKGLVFNAGERVEGISNPLFTLGIAGAMALGGEPRLASMIAGTVAYFAIAAILAQTSYSQRTAGKPWIPLGAAVWLVQDDLHTWATGGLETTVFAAFALAGIRRAADERATWRSLAASGTWLTLACLTRPDGVVFAAIGVIAAFSAAVERGERVSEAGQRIVPMLLPLVGLGGAFVALKLAYFGRLLPTTFYAKSALDPYYSRGLVYLALYAVKHWAMSLAGIALPVWAIASDAARALLRRRDALVHLVTFASFSLYVAHSGGDYMFARRLVPALPFLFVFLDAVVSVLPSRAGTIAAAALVGGSFFPYPLFPRDRPAYVHGVVDERVFYPEAVLEARRLQAHAAQAVFGGLDLRASFGGGMCMFAYYSDLPYLIEPNGLTQYWAAERRLTKRGSKIGHEKSVSRDELRSHGATFIFHRDLPPIVESEPRFDEILVGRILRVEMLVYDDGIMGHLAKVPGVRFDRIDQTLHDAATDIKKMDCTDARTSLASLQSFYLDRHPALKPPIQSAVDAACGSPLGSGAPSGGGAP